MKAAIIPFMLAVMLASGCTSQDGTTDLPPAENQTHDNTSIQHLPGDGWLCGSFRVNGRDAASRMDMVIEAAKQAGFSFFGMLIEPERPEQLEACRSAAASGILCIPCQEAGNDEGSLVAIGISETIPDNQSLQGMIDRIHEGGGVAYITHPMHSGNGTSWKRWDISGWDGLAVVSPMTQTRPDDEKAIEKWHVFLNNGHAKYAFGETNTRGFTSSYSLRNILDSSYQCLDIKGNLTEDSVKQALLEGRFYVTNNPVLNFTVNGRGSGQEVHAEYGEEVEIFIDVRSDSAFSTVRILRNSEVIQEIGRLLMRYNATMNSTVVGDTWFTAEVWGNDYTPEYHDFVHAFSNPVWVRVNSTA
jgi:hypothetical protein